MEIAQGGKKLWLRHAGCGDLGNYYGAGASALTFHENLYTLTFKPGKEGRENHNFTTRSSYCGLES